MPERIEITLAEAQHVLYVVGDYRLGVAPGAADLLLIRAIQHADEGRKQQFALAFPGLVAAIRMASGTVEVLERLRTFARTAGAREVVEVSA